MEKKAFILGVIAIAAAGCAKNEINIIHHDGYTIVSQTRGPELGYNEDSGVRILNIDGFAFKDLDKDGELDVYEDWRRPVAERAKDLASKMPIERICGLMLYSSAVDAMTAELTPKQTGYLRDDYIRHMLVRNIADAATGAEWSNRVQAFCEAEPFGIPSNNSTDPRNYTNGQANTNTYKPEPDGEFDPDGTSKISLWPREVGMAATFDPAIARRHGEIVSSEYRALGITTALSPQADLSTDPRWRRFYGTFSESPELNRDIVREYCDAFQTTEGANDGWGRGSVNCMVKHWPGGGTGESGRDAHFGTGKYAVYPGDNFAQNLIPFIDGAFKLRGGTGMASAVMPYYTISYDQDPSGENVGNGFSHYIIQELLRDKYRYEGVVCTDWGIVNDYSKVYEHRGTPWGMETQSPAERRLKCFEAGVDQLGGAADNSISLEAYRLWEEKYGKESARERFELSAVRLLTNIFRVGNFENPYVDPQRAAEVVGCREYVAAGYEAQLKSVVMLKNHASALPQKERAKVWQPMRHVAAGLTHWQQPTLPYDEYPFGEQLLGKYFDIAATPEEADFALVAIKSPIGHWGYILPNKEHPDGHYQPISLQYSPYTAEFARERSIAGGDPTEVSDNRSYRGFTETTSNEGDMRLVLDTKAAMGDKPVIVVISCDRPFVPAEIEPAADALLLAFGVSSNALLDIISGRFEPYGLLPMQLPSGMKTVEEQCEDVPFDMECYRDSDGNAYDFAFGLNWNGGISDSRVRTYGKR